MGFQLKSMWLVLLISFFLVACENTENNKSQDSKATQSSINTNDALHDEHAGHNHGPSKPADAPVTADDYDIFDKPISLESKDKVVVYEFFSYACPHCFSFQPYMESWLENKSEYVTLVRIPLNFQPSWEVLQKAYLTSESMGIVNESHLKLFNAIHNQKKRFNSIEELAEWYEKEIGVNKGEFLSTANSFILDSKIRKADTLGYKMQITSTPTVIVNGKLRASRSIHNRDRLMTVLDFLVKKEAKEMGLITD